MVDFHWPSNLIEGGEYAAEAVRASLRTAFQELRIEAAESWEITSPDYIEYITRHTIHKKRSRKHKNVFKEARHAPLVCPRKVEVRSALTESSGT